MERGIVEAVRAPEAADWALAHGIDALTSGDVARLLDVPETQVRQRLNPAVRRGQWVMPTRGLWFAVPPEFRTWGAPPGIEIINTMMRHVGARYYVGWLSAAAIHGAAHQAPQVFQIAVDRLVRDRIVGRTRFSFAQRSDIASVPTVSHATRSGTALVSSVAATMLDVASDIDRAGGLDNAATVICELGELDAFTMSDLIALAPSFPASAIRRAGWMLATFTDHDGLDDLQSFAHNATPTPSRLDPAGIAAGTVDHDWMLYLNRDVEPDL
ncbi:hypothetical protein E3T54_11980 [Cryobacterium sp. Sr8]|nr:hypothetical protein E3T54_11980 [Cryobacterium sp. Sr8]